MEMLINLASSLITVNEISSDNKREYGLQDKIGVGPNGGAMTCKDWTEKWWLWFLGMGEKENPFVLTSPHLNTVKRSKGNQPDELQLNSMKKSGQSVWYLAAPPYGVEGLVRVRVPPNWSILASPYNAIASPEFYPNSSMTDVLNEDLDGVYNIYATLDGIRLTGCTVKEDKPFEGDLPEENIFDGPAGKHHLVQYGHWVFLKPPPLGDHLLHLHGHSKNYQLDITYHLMVHGPAI
jgi:hypothetical protein